MSRRLTLASAYLIASAASATAGDAFDWNVSPFETSLGDWTASLGGSVSSAGYWARQDALTDRWGVTGSALLDAKVARTLDNGWDLAIHAVFLPWHDALSGDPYGNRFFEKEFVSLQLPYGRFEVGQTDGAANAMSVTGPSVEERVSIDDGFVTFFRDPTTGEAFTDIFRPRTNEFASENFGKISYFTPRLFGVQLGGSYTPNEAQQGLPFAGNGPDVPNRVTNILEAAANFDGDVGPASLKAYASAATGHDDARTPNHNDLFDWATGAEIDTDVEDVRLAFGAGFRQSNAYTFGIDDAFRSGSTHALRLSATATKGPWIAGLEFSNARADHEPGLPALRETGYQPSFGYVVNSNLQLTAGWQHLQYVRDTGTFYGGGPKIALEAAFLHLQFHV